MVRWKCSLDEVPLHMRAKRPLLPFPAPSVSSTRPTPTRAQATWVRSGKKSFSGRQTM